MSDRDSTDDVPLRDRDRGQAFTLEGFIASIVILTAVLFALQAIVITPTSGGAVDQEVRSQLRTQAHDVLVVTAHNDTANLSHVVRFWNGTPEDTEASWAFAQSETIGYGPDEPPFAFGEMLNESFKQQGRVFNVIVEFRNGTDRTESDTARMVYRGVPSDNAIVTTYTLTLFDNQTLTGPKATDGIATECGVSSNPIPLKNTTRTNPTCDPYFPIPDAFPDSPIYNIVEVRVIVW